MLHVPSCGLEVVFSFMGKTLTCHWKPCLYLLLPKRAQDRERAPRASPTRKKVACGLPQLPLMSLGTISPLYSKVPFSRTSAVTQHTH